MKKTIAILTSCLTLMSSAVGIIPYTPSPIISSAESLTFQDWEYEITDGTVTLTKYNGDPDYTTNFVIDLPKSINGMKVTSIAENAFSKKRHSWCKLVVPEDSECIFQKGALNNGNLQIIYGDFLLECISSDSGDYLSLLEWTKIERKPTAYYDPSLDIPLTTTSPPMPMSTVPQTAAYIPTTTTSATNTIQQSSTSTLTTTIAPWSTSPVVTTKNTEKELIMYDVTIPESICGYPVKSFSSTYIFSNAANLRKVTLPDTIVSLRNGLFKSSSITEVNIPKNVRFIPDNCFAKTANLEKVSFHDDILVVSQSAFDNSAFPMPEKYKDENAAVYSHEAHKTIGEWIVNIGISGSKLTTSLKRYLGTDEVLTIPSEIGGMELNSGSNDNILLNNETVKEVVFADGVKNCPKMSSPYLEKVTLPDTIESVNSFDNCSALKSIVIPSNVKSLSGLRNCSSLRELTIQSDVLTISTNFAGTPLTELELPGNCIINTAKFSPTIETIRFRAGDSVTIYNDAFKNSQLKNLVFSPDIKEINISNSAFRNTQIEKLELPSGKITIGNHAFRDCHNLKEVVINGDATISSSAFTDCTALEKVTLKGKSSVDDYSFDGCNNLTDVSFNLDDNISGRCFNNCPKLLRINGIEVIDESGTEFAPELKDYVMNNCQTADGLAFIDRFTINSAKKIVSEVTDESMTEIEKIKTLHDWVCANTVYDMNDENNLANHVDSAVFFDGMAVCEGYAKAFNLLLHEAGIETCLVHNGVHAWNVVKVDGKWFHIDTTWDDGEPYGYYWFLKTDAFLISQGGPHETWSLFAPSSLHSFQPSELPECITEIKNCTSDGSFTLNDAEAVRANAIKNNSYSIEYDYNLDGRLNAADIADAYSKATGSDYIIGDVNSDGKVDSKDASDVLTEYSNVSVGGTSILSPDSAIMADIKADGKVDSSDASEILAYYSYVATGGDNSLSSYFKKQ